MNNKKRPRAHVALAGAAGLVLVATTAAAHPSHRAGKGKWKQRRAKMIQKFDTNKDGKLDRAERRAMREARLDRVFARLDTDKSGTLSAAEVSKARPRKARRLMRADLDKNGVITKAELRAAAKQMRRAGKRRHMRNGKRRRGKYGAK